jgi:hypothetical protein
MNENEPKLFKKYTLDNRFNVKYIGKNDENTGYLFEWNNPKNEKKTLNRHFQHINEQSLIPIEDEEEGSTDNEIEDDPFSGVPNHNMNPEMFNLGAALGVIGKNKKSKKNTKSKRNTKSKKNRKSKRNKRNRKSKLLHKI